MGCCCPARVGTLEDSVILAQEWKAAFVEDDTVLKIVKPSSVLIELQRQEFVRHEHTEPRVDPGTAMAQSSLDSNQVDEKAQECDEYDCQICYGSSEYALSLDCQHFFCRDCIAQSLQFIKDVGQFPAFCPSCRAEAVNPEEAAHNESPLMLTKGRIDPSVLTFLRQRGVISQEFQFNFWKLDEMALKNHYNESHEAVFIHEKDSSYLKPGMCPCGAIVCFKCHQVLTVKDDHVERIGENHVCPEVLSAPGPIDDLSSETIASLCRKCPQCGFPCEKNEGCSVLQCGTTCHGKVNDALRNGGCSFLFDWKTLEGRNSLYIDEEGKRVWNGNPITHRQRRYVEVFLELKRCATDMAGQHVIKAFDGRAITVVGGNKSNGSVVRLGSQDQHWQVRLASPAGDAKAVYSLHPQHCPNKCLDVHNVSFQPGHFVHLWEYASQHNQRWRLSADEQLDNVFYIVSCNSGMALEVEGDTIVQNPLRYDKISQRFLFERVGEQLTQI